MDKLIKQFQVHLEESFNTYKTKMLENDKDKIFAMAYQINFYDCIYDYLYQYEWEDNVEHINRLKLLNQQKDILFSLWDVYIETEWLGFSSWSEIDDLMGEFYNQNKINL